MRKRIKHFAIAVGSVLLGISCVTIHASEPTTRESQIENWSPMELASLKGKIVVFEGLYWGLGWPTLGSRVVLPSGQRVYLHDLGRGDDIRNGNLVRVRGKLVLRHMNARTKDSAGYKAGFDYWSIEDPILEKIDRVESGAIRKFEQKKPPDAPQRRKR